MKIPSEELKPKVLAVRDELHSPKSHLQAHWELYELLVAPMEEDLKGAHVTTIPWSRDAVLHYLPMAALYDGKQ